MSDLQDTVALVTGASSGIGAATARRLAGLGATVALVARRRERLEDLARVIETAGGTALTIEADVTDRAQASDAVARTVQRLMDRSISRPPARTIQVAGIAGSLRQASLNRALLRAAVELAPPEMNIVTVDITDVPLYNGDVEETFVPPGVIALRDSVSRADALLIATPEYNHGVPGVLKNAIDWLSRPPRGSVLNGKSAAVIGASPGMTGTARAQTQLRQAFAFTNTYVMLQPEVLVARAQDKFNRDGRLTDEATRQVLSGFLAQFVGWIGYFARRDLVAAAAALP